MERYSFVGQPIRRGLVAWLVRSWLAGLGHSCMTSGVSSTWRAGGTASGRAVVETGHDRGGGHGKETIQRDRGIMNKCRCPLWCGYTCSPNLESIRGPCFSLMLGQLW
ncbi:hypothetical protein BB8028_0003g06540 [Beauveria bassiana]|uniref:Uncharacterized protein n=1 Tax=Beauveria bassiana TaxID=176275 RepID=A0A2S7Y7C4_BEABA|nr:hypothetical protein BB8028_0003g06540 [Beauveria bassiana]